MVSFFHVCLVVFGINILVFLGISFVEFFEALNEVGSLKEDLILLVHYLIKKFIIVSYIHVGLPPRP